MRLKTATVEQWKQVIIFWKEKDRIESVLSYSYQVGVITSILLNARLTAPSRVKDALNYIQAMDELRLEAERVIPCTPTMTIP